MECSYFRDAASDAVHQIFLALESLEEMLKYTNPLMLYDLEKHHPASFQKLREYKYRFLYQVIVENLEWGVSAGLYRADIDKDVVAKVRIEPTISNSTRTCFPTAGAGYQSQLQAGHAIPPRGCDG